MPINQDLLIAAPMLQDYLVDKDGTPMSGGTITCYQDNSRTTLKNWYYQSGTPGNYTYIKLPNPLTLSAAGTICDINGVDTIPFFYPYDENNETTSQPYYITIVNKSQTNQITRANFPFIGTNSGNNTAGSSFNNLIINNGFWRNLQPNNLNTTFSSVILNNILTTQSNGLLGAKVAPSQHDGYRFHDIIFFKNNNAATDTLTFTPFALANSQPISQTNVPEYYINHIGNATSGSGETTKYYQFPIALHVNSLQSVPFTVSIQAQNAGGTGTGQNVLGLYILQDTGTGTPNATPMLINQITLNSSWQTYTFTDIFPSTSGLTLGQGSDDALYLLVELPLNTPFTINFTKPSIYLTENVVPAYDYQSYDVINSVISSPRTGDVRMSLNMYQPYGWIPMNDGVIGLNQMNVTSTPSLPGYSRANADTFNLYNLLWNLASTLDSGSNFNPICQMYTNTGTALVATNFGTSAYSDFTANKALQLTKMFGKVIMGTTTSRFANYNYQSVAVNATNSSGNLLLTPTSMVGFWQGAPIIFGNEGGSLPGNIAANVIYYVTNLSGSSFNVAASYANAIAGGPVIPFSSAGSHVFVNLNLTGSSIGEYGHTQATNEVGPHTHTLVNPFQMSFTAGNSASGSLLYPVVGSGTPITYTLQGTPLTGVNANSVSSNPFNVTQPGTFYNIFMKL